MQHDASPSSSTALLLRRRRRARERRGAPTSCSTASPTSWPSGLSAVLRQLRACGRSRHAGRCGAARARGQRQGRAHRRGQSDRCAGAGDRWRSSPTRRRCRSRDGALDLVVSALALQFVNDLPGALVQIRRALQAGRPVPRRAARRRHADRAAPGLRASRSGDRAAAPRRGSRRSPTCASSARCCSAPASRCRSTDVDRVTVRYASPLALMRDLRAHGRDQRAGRAAAARRCGARPCARMARNLRRALRRSRRPRARDVRDRLAVGLGAAREPAAAAAPGRGAARGSPTRSATTEQPAGEKADEPLAL